MKFLKENSYNIIRLYINQIGITIFSLVLYFSVLMLEDKDLSLKLQVAISIFAMLFFFSLLYTAAWDWGANDKIRIDGGRMKKMVGKGALLSVMANLINFLLAGGCVISELIIKDGNGFISQLFRPILLLTNAIYIGVIKTACASSSSVILFESLGYLIAPLLSILATHIGYVFGLKNKKIFPTAKKPANKN